LPCHHNILLLHASENAIIILVTASTRVSVGVIVLHTRVHLLVHLHVTFASENTSSKTLGLTAREAVDEARADQRRGVIEVLRRDRRDWGRICGKSNGSTGTAVAAKATTEKLDSSCQVTVFLPGRVDA
jgi:hypothetical protein